MRLESISKPFPLSNPLSDCLLGRTFAGGLSLPSGGDSGPQSLTNAEKLSLPANTPVGTEVMVSDWEAAGLAGPHQRLKAPSTAQVGFSILGAGIATANGIYTESGTTGGKSSYIGGPFSFVVEWITDHWEIRDDGDLGVIYSSTDDVAKPWLVMTWIKETAGELPLPTTAVLTQGDWDAGTSFTGAGNASANVTLTPRGTYYSRPYYNKVGSPTTIPEEDTLADAVWWDADVFVQKVGTVTTYNANTDSVFPWLASWSGQPADEPAPTVIRNTVCVESNWEVTP